MQGKSQYTLQGVLTYLSGDSADHAISVARYFLIAGETRTELLFDAPPWHGYLGRQVVVEGTAVSMEGNTVLTMRVSRVSLPVGEQAALPQAAPVTGTRRVILLLVKFSGDSLEPHPANWYTDIFNPSSGNTVNSYYLANSWGQFGWSADATNWMTGMDSKTTYANCGWGVVCLDYNHLFNDAVARGVANGVNFALYDNIAIVTNNDLDCCAWGASAWYYNGKYYGVVWQPPWSAQVGTFAHELGHSIGLPHSGWVYYSYDSPWDVMSKGDQIYNNVNCGSYFSANSGGATTTIYCPTPADIIAPYKDLMGWIDASHLLTVTAGTPASAPVDTLAAPLSASKKMIKICLATYDCTSDGPAAVYYTVEVRTHYGFDSYLQTEGVIIHKYDYTHLHYQPNSCFFNDQSGPAYPVDNFNVVAAPHYDSSGCPWGGNYQQGEIIGGQRRGLYYANWNDGQFYAYSDSYGNSMSIVVVGHSTVGGVSTYELDINGGAPYTATTTVTSTLTQTSTSYSYRTATTTVTSYTSTSTLTSTIPTVTTVVLVPLTVTSTEQSTQFLTSVVTTTVTNYTGTTTSTSTIPTTVALVPLTMTSTAQSTQYLTSILTTTVTNYTSTETSTSTIPTLTTVILVPSSVTSTVQSTQLLTSILTTTVTSYTSTETLTSTIPTVTTVVLLLSTVTSTTQGTQYLTSILTTTVTNYTATTTSTSTSVVYTTVTASPGGAGPAGAGASSPLAYLGFISVLAVAVVIVKPWKKPEN